jgi:glucose-1-phosphate cytidylyltransferase
MKTVILCGGLGTRLREETNIKPKPMVEIGEKPILWHILKSYEKHGFNDFLLALGYKGELIKDYFLNYHAHKSDIQINLADEKVKFKNGNCENWNLGLINTGAMTMTGGRLLRLKKYIGNNTFMLTYGDGVCDVDIKELLKFHKSHGKLATVTAVRPPVRFGELLIENDNNVKSFQEKPQAGEGWINGGFFIFEPKIFDFVNDDSIMLERQPLEKLAKMSELRAYKHEGFWQCMDTIRDRDFLNKCIEEGNSPWL